MADYYSDLGRDNREATDSTLAEKPKFITKNGRIVYGGGGITPDIFSELELDFSESSREILSHPDRLTFKYAGELKEKIQSTYEDFESFTRNYKMKEKGKKQFYEWLIWQEIEFSKGELDENWAYLENRILSEVASRIWGKEYLFRKLLDEDTQVQEAMLHFGEAHKLIHEYSQFPAGE